MNEPDRIIRASIPWPRAASRYRAWVNTNAVALGLRRLRAHRQDGTVEAVFAGDSRPGGADGGDAAARAAQGGRGRNRDQRDGLSARWMIHSARTSSFCPRAEARGGSAPQRLLLLRAEAAVTISFCCRWSSASRTPARNLGRARAEEAALHRTEVCVNPVSGASLFFCVSHDVPEIAEPVIEPLKPML